MDTAAHRKRRDLRTIWLYFLAIARLFRGSLLLALALVFLATVTYRLTPSAGLDGGRPSWLLSLYGAWMAMLAQPIVERPEAWHLVLMQSTYPLFGFAVIGEGIVRFALLMVSRQRGEKEWMMVMASTYRDHVILCGLGNLGHRVLAELLAQRNDVVVIERNPQARFTEEARARNVPLIVRDMKDQGSLVEAGIAHARAVVLATDDDLANVEAALDARVLNPSVKVVVRLFDQELARKLKDVVAFDAPFSSSALAAPVVAAMTIGDRVLAAFTLGGVLHVTVELSVEPRSALVGASVSSVESERRLRVLARVPREGEPELPPSGATVFSAGDELTLHVTAAGLGDLRALARAG